MCHPIGSAPYQVAERMKETKRLADVRLKYSTAIATATTATPKSLSHKEKMANQITDEINERCEYLKSMQELGTDPSKLAAVKADIARRVSELKTIEKSFV